MISRNLVLTLLQDGPPAAVQIPSLLEEIEYLRDPAHWRLIETPPVQALAALRRHLLDLYAVLSETEAGGQAARRAIRIAAGSGGSLRKRPMSPGTAPPSRP